MAEENYLCMWIQQLSMVRIALIEKYYLSKRTLQIINNIQSEFKSQNHEIKKFVKKIKSYFNNVKLIEH